MVDPDTAARHAQGLTPTVGPAHRRADLGNQETAMPALLIALAVMLRRRLPSIWSVLLVLAVLAAAALVALHAIAAWITGHPFAISLALVAAVAAAVAGTRRAR